MGLLINSFIEFPSSGTSSLVGFSNGASISVVPHASTVVGDLLVILNDGESGGSGTVTGGGTGTWHYTFMASVDGIDVWWKVATAGDLGATLVPSDSLHQSNLLCATFRGPTTLTKITSSSDIISSVTVSGFNKNVASKGVIFTCNSASGSTISNDLAGSTASSLRNAATGGGIYDMIVLMSGYVNGTNVVFTDNAGGSGTISGTAFEFT